MSTPCLRIARRLADEARDASLEEGDDQIGVPRDLAYFRKEPQKYGPSSTEMVDIAAT